MDFFNAVILAFGAFINMLFVLDFGGISVGAYMVATAVFCMILRFAFGGLWESLFGGDN